MSNCGFDLHFLNEPRSYTSFHTFAAHSYVLFEETSVQILRLFFDCVVGLPLYIPNTRRFSDIRLTNTYSHYEDCLSTFLIMSFDVKVFHFVDYLVFLLLLVLLMSNLRTDCQIQESIYLYVFPNSFMF